MKRILTNSEGQSMAEFALVLPVLLFILLGIMDFGRIFYTFIVVNEAARDSARYASLGGKDAQLRSTIKADTPTLDYSKETIVIQPSDSSRGSGQPVTISISYPVSLMTPLLGSVLPDPFIVASTMTMRVE